MDLMEKLVSLCKRRGFIFPSSEIYGGLNGCWDYGPLGVELKRNIKEAWWQDMVACHDDISTLAGAPSSFSMVGLDCSILMNPKVWEASGHVGGFSDPMVDCRETKSRFRADQLVVLAVQKETDGAVELLEPYFAVAGEAEQFASPVALDDFAKSEAASVHKKRLKDVQKKNKGEDLQVAPVPSEVLGGAVFDATLRDRTVAPGASEPGTLTDPREFNLMFKTHVGALEDRSSIAYLRPETAQGIFVNFKNVFDTARVRVPFGIAQIGKAFRNEINPRNFTFRSREFEQMEIEFFCRAEDSAQWYTFWRDRRFQWYMDLGLQSDKLRLRDHAPDELAHYAQGCADVEYEFPFGVSELEGVANRADYDLKQHIEHSGKDLQFFDDQIADKEKRRFVPHVIEPSAGADRAALAFLCEAYAEDEVGGEARVVMKFHPRVAPIKAAVFPLVRKDGMPEKAQQIYHDLKKRYNVFYDEKGAIGRRYRRQDEAGTPYCITVDGETLTDGTVTLRDRDSTEQTRIPVDGVTEEIGNRLGLG